MPEANLARLGSAVPMVVASRDCADAPVPTARWWRLTDGHATTPCRCEQRPIPWTQEMGRCFLARYRPNVFSEGPGRQKGVSQARYSRDVFPSNVFHRFSRLKSYITSLSCQKQAVRACISAISCHEEAFLPSGAPSGMHDSHFLPLLDARPFHAGHPEGHLGGINAAFLLRSPFRSRLRRAFHRARNR